MKSLETTTTYFDRVAARFNSNYERGDCAFEERRQVWGRLIAHSLLRLRGSCGCIDLGCGDGTLGRLVAARGHPVIGIDQSEGMLAVARRLSQQQGLGTHSQYLHARLPLDEDTMRRLQGTAGLVLCSSVLEYVESYEAILRQAHALLVPGGRLIVSIPNGHSLYRLAERLFAGMRTHRDAYQRYQRHHFYPQRFRTLVQSLGYSPVCDEYFSLPLQSYTSRLFGRYRSKRTAALYVLVAERP